MDTCKIPSQSCAHFTLLNLLQQCVRRLIPWVLRLIVIDHLDVEGGIQTNGLPETKPFWEMVFSHECRLSTSGEKIHPETLDGPHQHVVEAPIDETFHQLVIDCPVSLI